MIMENNRKKRLFRLVCWLPAVLMAAAIFGFSAQPADVSTETSNFVTKIILGLGDKVNMFHIPSEEVARWCETLSMPVRKTAHMTEYAVFYGTILLGLWGSGVRGRRWPKLAFLLTVFYACTDEFHQLFVPGRAGRITDVLIDSAGAAVITLVLIRSRKVFQGSAEEPDCRNSSSRRR